MASFNHTNNEGGIIMNQPPKMISTKDSGSFDDQLNTILVLSKKVKSYKESVEDKDIQMTLDRLHSMLKTHYSKLLECLNG